MRVWLWLVSHKQLLIFFLENLWKFFFKYEVFGWLNLEEEVSFRGGVFLVVVLTPKRLN